MVSSISSWYHPAKLLDLITYIHIGFVQLRLRIHQLMEVKKVHIRLDKNVYLKQSPQCMKKKVSLKICKCVPESKTIPVKKTRHQSEHPPLRYSLSKWHIK